MAGAFRAEILKLRKRWATWMLGASLVLLVVGVGYVLGWLGIVLESLNTSANAEQSLKNDLLPQHLPTVILRTLVAPGGAIALLLGVLTAGSEYGWNTVKTILTQRPGRMGVLLGKAAALLAMIVVYLVTTFAASLMASYVTSGLVDQPTTFPSVPRLLESFGAGLLILAAWGAFGFFLATLFRGTALAVELGLGYAFIIESIIGGLSSMVSFLKPVLDYLLQANSVALGHALSQSGDSSTAETGIGAGIGPAHASLVLIGWLLVAMALTMLAFKRRDVA